MSRCCVSCVEKQLSYTYDNRSAAPKQLAPPTAQKSRCKTDAIVATVLIRLRTNISNNNCTIIRSWRTVLWATG